MKQVIILREDLRMSPGKAAAQACHASLAAYNVAPQEFIDAWQRHGVTKIVLGVDSEFELLQLYKHAVAHYLPASLIADEGRTEVNPGTITACCIGPAPKERINEITGKLSLYGKADPPVSEGLGTDTL